MVASSATHADRDARGQMNPSGFTGRLADISIVAVAGDGQRALDLYGEDEWRWAVLARGRRVGAEEVVRADGLRIQLTFPAPVQLRAAMDILGSPSGAWAWDVSPKGPDLWRLLT